MRPSDRPAATPLAERIASVSTRPQTAPGPEPADVERDWGYAYPTASSGVPVPTAGNAETVSIGRALRSVLGRFGTLLVAFFFLFASVGFLSERGPNGDDIAGVALLLVLVTFWLGGIVWAQRTAGWGWASGFFACWLIALPWLMVRRARAGTSEHARQFPAFWASGALTIIGAMLFVAGISNGGSGGTADASGNPTNGDRIAIAAPTELPEDSMQSAVTTGTGSASSEIALPSATVTATATVAATMTATPPPSPTIAPTDTPTPRPTKTPTPKPTRTPKPKPTRTPKPKPTRTPRPSAAYDPDETVQFLHDTRFTSDEYDGSRPAISWSQEPFDGSVGDIAVVTSIGVMQYSVFPSDREAEQFVKQRQSGHDWAMPDYPDLVVATDSLDDGYYFYAAAIGNVVVVSVTSDSYLISTGAFDPDYNADVFAALQTEFGVQHLLRVLGEPSRHPSSDASGTF